MCNCLYTCVLVCAYECVRVCECECVDTCVYACTCGCMCVCVHVCLSVNGQYQQQNSSYCQHQNRKVNLHVHEKGCKKKVEDMISFLPEYNSRE